MVKTTPSITIAWPSRTRDVTAPGTAQFAEIVFEKAMANGDDLSYTAYRPSGAESTTRTYASPQSIRAGVYFLRVGFRANGSYFVGQASTNVRVASDGTLTLPDGGPLGTIGFTGGLSVVEIPAEQALDIDETKDLIVTAYSSNGLILPILYGAIQFEVTEGAEHLRLDPNGSFTGLSEGEATVVATVDGKRSSASRVRINGPALTTRTLELATNELRFDPSRGKVWASLSQTSGNANAVVSIDTATGALGVPIVVGDEPTTMALSDDGSTMAVGLKGTGAVRFVDLNSGTARGQFEVRGGGASYAAGLAFQPGSASVLAVGIRPKGSTGLSGLTIYDDGVPRPLSTNTYGTDRLAWTEANRIVATNDTAFHDYSVDANGAALGSQTVFFPGRLGQSFFVQEGRLYTAYGVVLNATTRLSLGQFPGVVDQFQAPAFAGPAVDTVAGKAYFVVATAENLRLRTYRLDSLQMLTDKPLAGVESLGAHSSAGEHLVRWGAHGLAFRNNGKIVIVDEVPGL